MTRMLCGLKSLCNTSMLWRNKIPALLECLQDVVWLDVAMEHIQSMHKDQSRACSLSPTPKLLPGETDCGLGTHPNFFPKILLARRIGRVLREDRPRSCVRVAPRWCRK